MTRRRLLIAGGSFAIDPANLAIGSPPDMPTLARSRNWSASTVPLMVSLSEPSAEPQDPVRQ